MPTTYYTQNKPCYLESKMAGSPLEQVELTCIALISSCILTHFLAQIGNSQTQMVGAFVLSVPWNCFSSSNSLEEPLNWLLFNRHLTQKLLKMVRKYVGIVLRVIGWVKRSKYRRVTILGAPLTFSFSSPFSAYNRGALTIRGTYNRGHLQSGALRSGALTIGVRSLLGSENRYKNLASMVRITIATAYSQQ